MPDSAKADFLHPTKKCDIVMKGGITSGVVYPAAVCELAPTYRFMNIGGTSAGAIAAAATAAAEYRRQRYGSGEGFVRLAQLPEFLASTPSGSRHTNLYWLFQPDPSSRFLFNLGLSFTKKGWRVTASIFAALLTGAPLVWLVVIVLGLGYAFTPIFVVARSSFFTTASVLLWLLLLFSAGIGLTLVRGLRALPPIGFGLCSGKTQAGANGLALADWFHGFLNDLAGKPNEAPLTFGDLQVQGIQLRMLTTNVTHGRPYGLPIDTANFYFKPDELAMYFPPSVIQWMKNNPGPVSVFSEPIDTTGFSPLPHPANLPVVVAARMSLSFPFLFRAVPLYAVDYTLLRRDTTDPTLRKEPGGALQPKEPRVPERCWFLDGGICSNFPISMFDAPLPGWPTFGIDLQSLRKDRPDSFVWLPERNEEGLGELWNRIPATKALAPIAGYVAGLINAARNWADNRQMTVPGYRDRIVHIRLDDKNEGGLNLDMPTTTVTTISNRGRGAAQELLDHFAHPKENVSLTWDNHRWIRFRSLLAQLDNLLVRFHETYARPESGERTYRQLLDRERDQAPASYRVATQQRDLITDVVDRLIEVASVLEAAPSDQRPTSKAPRPAPALHVLPRTVPESDVDRPDVVTHDPPHEGERSLEQPT